MDEDNNFICDICDAKVSFLNFVETKVVATLDSVSSGDASGDSVAEISGKMPKDTSAKFSEVTKTEAISIVKEYNETIENESIIAAFDISLSSNDVKYQPNEFRNSVDVKISNLELDTSKTYAILHEKEDGSYELLPVSVLNENEIKFKARSFSTYILITVEGHSLSFSGDGNYTVQDEYGNEIVSGTTVASGTNFTFVVVPNEGYVVTSITCKDSEGNNKITLSGNGANVTGIIDEVTEELEVNIETILEANLVVPIVDGNYIFNGSGYSTLAQAYAALKAAGKTGEIIVNQDIENETTEMLVEAGYNVTLNLQTNKLTMAERIRNRGTLTIKGNGELINGATAYSGILFNGTTGTLNINDATIKSYVETVDGTINIYSGTILYDGTYGNSYDDTYFNLIGCLGSINMYGGSIKVLSNVEKVKYAMELNGGTFNMYSGEIIHETNIATSCIIIKNDAEFNMYNGTITMANYYGINLSSNATVNIIDGTINTSNYAAFYVNRNSTLNVLGGRIESAGKQAIRGKDTSIINIGTSGDTVSTTTPELIGGTSAITTTSGFNFYDGILKGGTAAYDGTVNDVEDGYAVYTEDSAKTAYLKKNITDVTLGTTSFTYDGQAKTPTVTVKWNGTTLTKDTHYTVTYANNTNAGTATVTVTGKGDYTGTVEKTFTINPASITGTVTISGTLTYGSKLTPKITGLTPSDATVTYQWFSNSTASTTGGTSIGTSKTEQLTADSFGKYVYVVVTATKENYETTTLTSNVTSSTIAKRPITVTAASATKVFDGTPLTNPEFTVSEKMAISSHSVKATITSSITDVGSVANTFDSVLVKNTSDSNVSKYYDITTVNGTLTITKANATLTPAKTSTSIAATKNETISYTYTGDGKVTAKSSNTNVATVTVNESAKTITITGVTGGTATITISAAVGTNYNAAANATINVTVASGNYTVNGKDYETLTEAYAGLKLAGTSGEIIVNKDVEERTQIDVDEGYNVTLNTNGKKITEYNCIYNRGTLTIKGTGEIFQAADNTIGWAVGNRPAGTLNLYDATINALFLSNGILNIHSGTLLSDGTNKWCFETKGTTNMYGGTIKATSNADNGDYALYLFENAVFNMYGGEIIGENTKAQISIYLRENSTFNMYGGTITTSNYYGINADGNSTINIIDGTINATDYAAIYIYDNVKLNVTGGTINNTGEYAVRANAGGGNIVVNIGKSGDSVSTTSPELIGGTYAIKSGNGFNFYDGILKGTTGAISLVDGTTVTTEPGYAVYTENSGKTAYLKKNITDVTLGTTTYTYNGQAKTPTVTVKWQGATLTAGKDYTVTYDNNTNAGTNTAKVIITGSGDYMGTKEVLFTINKATMSGSISITGENTIGKTLTANTNSVVPTAGTTFTYVWWTSTSSTATSGTAISGATSSTYVLTDNELGKYVGVTVTASNANYNQKVYTDITDASNEVAATRKAWDVSHPDNADDEIVMAYLVTDEANAGKYKLVISGKGKMVDFEKALYASTVDDKKWYAYAWNIYKIEICEGVTNVGDITLSGLWKVEEVTFPSTLERIGELAFYDCQSLKGTLEIPKNFRTLEDGAFNLTQIEDITVAEGNTIYRVHEGVLYNNLVGGGLVLYPTGKTRTSYTVLDGIKYISPYAFANTSLSNVVLPESLTILHSAAFQNSKITSITIPENTKVIEWAVFKGCTSLEKVYLKSKDFTFLDAEAFTNLKSGSIIYTANKTVADKLVAGTHYTDEKTDVYYPPVIRTQPTNQTVVAGNQATFEVAATAGVPSDITYKWQYRTSSEGTWQDATDAEGTGYSTASFTTIATTAEMNGYEYRCVVGSKDSAGNTAYPNEEMTATELALESNAAGLTVNKATTTLIPAKTTTIIGLISEEITYTYSGDGKVAVSSSDDKIATVTIDEENKKVTITGVSGGSAIITLTASEGTNYKAATATINVTVISDSKVILYANGEEYSGDKWANTIIAVIDIQNPTTTWIQYKIGETGEWTSEDAKITINGGTATVELKHGFIEDKVYFREINANGQSTTANESAGYVYKQEKIAPTIQNMNYETVEKQLKVSALLEDSYEIGEYAIAEVGVTPKVWYEAKGKEIISGDETVTLDTTAIKVSVDVKGSNTYVLYAKDKAGNISTNTLKVVKDIIPPKANVAIKDAREVDGEIFVKTDEIVLIIDATDNVSEPEEIMMAIFNETEYEALQDKSLIEWEEYTNRKTWVTEQGDGQKRIYILLKDKAGNISPKEVEWK